MNTINAKIVSKNRSGISFQAESPFEITRDAVVDAQAALGYIPAGYGLYALKIELDESQGVFKATWRCGSTCD